MIHIDYMPPKTTITRQYDGKFLKRLRDSIKGKRRGMLRHGVLLLHDNAPVHRANVAQVALREAGFDKLPQPPYSPDLSSSDFYLPVPLFESSLEGKKI